jgi:hypothetical protein
LQKRGHARRGGSGDPRDAWHEHILKFLSPKTEPYGLTLAVAVEFMADNWRTLLAEYEYAVDLLASASRTLTRALLTDGIPREEIEALIEAETKARDATASARLRLVNLWRATANGSVTDGMKPLSAEVLEIASQFVDLDDEDRVLIARLIQGVAAASQSVQDEVRERLTAPPKPTTQAELRWRVEAVVAYLDSLERE